MGSTARQPVVAVIVTAGALCCFAFATAFAVGSPGAQRAGGRTKVDLHALPLGDGKVSTSGARRGYVYSCTAPTGSGGASASGPWLNGDRTYDATAKATVDGAISWPDAVFSDAVSGATRTLAGNDLPTVGTTGSFPIASTDDAYLYDRNPNSIESQALSYAIAADPAKAASPTCLSGGPIGVAINGVAIFDALDAGGQDAVAHEVQDSCGGHPQQQGLYHYHSMPSCLTASRSKKSKLIGFALDGFPIYNDRDRDGARITNADLDACHGQTSKVKLDGTKLRTYHYNATREYPYTLGCFRGAPVGGATPGAP